MGLIIKYILILIPAINLGLNTLLVLNKAIDKKDYYLSVGIFTSLMIIIKLM